MVDWIVSVLVIALVAFIPSIVYLVWIRNTERYSKEPYGRLLKIFAYGAVFSVILALVFELLLVSLFDQNIERIYQFFGEDPNLTTLVLACIIAPFVEELTKAFGVFRARKLMHELENGMVYGAAAGLGFAATENLLYEGAAYLTDGAEAWIATAVVRSLSSALLHAAASSFVGLGIARSAMGKGGWFPYYLGGVLMHGAFNFFASFGVLYEGDFGESAYLFGLLAAFTIAILGIGATRSKIRSLDRGRRSR